MSLNKRLHDAIARKEAVVTAHHEEVVGIRGHYDEYAQEEEVPPFSAEVTLLDSKPFDRGWHATATDKSASGDAFPGVKAKLNKLKYPDRREFLFRLTIWRSKDEPRRKPCLIPGTALFVKEVTGLKVYHGVFEGAADVQDVMKTEEEDGRLAKKTKLKGDKTSDADDAANNAAKNEVKATK